MTIQKIVIHQYSIDQPQTLLEVHNPSKNRFAEFAGGTTAECAVVCCCFPLSLVNLLVLAVYGVPAGLYRKAMRKNRRRRLLKKGLLEADSDFSQDRSDRSSYDGSEFLIHRTIRYDATELFVSSPLPSPEAVAVDGDVIELENEMWEKFYGTGFWRSGSRRGD